MSKREDERLAALARKNAEKVVKPKEEKAARYDSTLRRKPVRQSPAFFICSRASS